MKNTNDQSDPHLSYEPIVEAYASEDGDPAMNQRCNELFMQSLPGMKVLEVGCGPGRDAARLRDAGCDVTAIDLCQGFITFATKSHSDIEFLTMDLQEPRFEDNTFDGVYGASCFCHVEPRRIPDVLSKYLNILKPDGVLFLLLPDSNQVDRYVVEDWGGKVGNTVEIVCHHRDEMKKKVEEAGFVQVSITPIHSPFYEEMPRLKKLGVRAYVVSGHKPTIE